MRTFLFIILSLLSGTYLPAQSSWYWYNPQPEGNHLNDIWFTAPDNGWAVGGGGKLLHFNGQKWIQNERLTFFSLNGLWFTDVNHGWAVGNGGTILQYVNGTWSQVYSGTTKNLVDVSFAASDDGWAVGDVRMHYDGTGWTTLDTIGYGGVTEVFFTDPQHGWCGGFNKFYTFENNTWNWTPLVSSDVIWVNAIYLTDSLNGWLGGLYSDGMYYIMNYNGNFWQWAEKWPPLNSQALYFENPEHGWSCGGQSWWWSTDTTVFEFYNNEWKGSLVTKCLPVAIAPSGDGDIFITTRYGHIYRHHGDEWDLSNSLAEGPIDLSFPDTTHGWAVGEGNHIIKYHSGEWTIDTTFPGMDLQHIHFVNDQDGFVSGWNKASSRTAIYRHSATGWELVTDTLNATVNDLCTLSGQDAWFCGTRSYGSGVVFHLSGNNLAFYHFNQFNEIRAISFTTNSDGWIIGISSYFGPHKIMHWNGFVWSVTLTSPADVAFLDLSFCSQSSGWLVGYKLFSHGISYFYNGTDWIPGPMSVSSIGSVFHPDPAHVYAISADTILTLENGAWEEQSLITGQNLVSLCYPAPGVGWVGGDHGGILSTRSPFAVAVPESKTDLAGYELTVTPNPASNSLKVILKPGALEPNTRLIIYDVDGKFRISRDLVVGQTSCTLDLTALSDGVYLAVLMVRDNAVAREKVIVRK